MLGTDYIDHAEAWRDSMQNADDRTGSDAEGEGAEGAEGLNTRHR